MVVPSDNGGDLGRSACLIRLLCAATLLFLWTSAFTDAAEIRIGYLREPEPKARLSLIEIPADDDGLAGARLAIEDNNTTGRFLNQQFSLDDARLGASDDPATASIALAGSDVSLVIADLAADALLKAADAGRPHG